MLPMTSAVNGSTGLRVRNGRTAAGWLSVNGTRSTLDGLVTRLGRRRFGRVKGTLTSLVVVVGLLSACARLDSDEVRAPAVTPRPSPASSGPTPAKDPVRVATPSPVPNSGKKPV